MEYKVSLVISPAKGAIGRLFSARGRFTEGVLKIVPEDQEVHIAGLDRMVSDIDRKIPFVDIQEIEAKGLENFDIKLRSSENIQFKSVDELSALLDDLGKYCKDTTHDLVRKRIEKYEQRVRRFSGN